MSNIRRERTLEPLPLRLIKLYQIRFRSDALCHGSRNLFVVHLLRKLHSETVVIGNCLITERHFDAMKQIFEIIFDRRELKVYAKISSLKNYNVAVHQFVEDFVKWLIKIFNLFNEVRLHFLRFANN